MSDWLQGNMGRLNAAIQAQAEAGRIKESKKNRFSTIAEGLSNNLFKRQSEEAAKQHEKEMENLMYGNPDMGTTGTRTAAQMKLNTQQADLEAASRSRSYEEYINTMKKMGLTPQLSQQDYLMGWAPSNYYDRYAEDKDKNANLRMYLDSIFKTTNGPAQYLSSDPMSGFNMINWSALTNPAGGIDEGKVKKAKEEMTKWLQGAVAEDTQISKLYTPAQKQDSVRRYVDDIFNKAIDAVAAGSNKISRDQLVAASKEAEKTMSQYLSEMKKLPKETQNKITMDFQSRHPEFRAKGVIDNIKDVKMLDDLIGGLGTALTPDANLQAKMKTYYELIDLIREYSKPVPSTVYSNTGTPPPYQTQTYGRK